MFKRMVTTLTAIAVFTLFPNAMARARAFSNTSRDSGTAKEKRPSCTGAQGLSALDSIDQVVTLGRRTQIQPFASLQRTIFDGTTVNMVSTSTGHLAFAVTDLEIPGSMPLIFQRTFASDRSEDTGLGTGWSFVFDDRITLADDTATLSTGTGLVATFRRDGQSQRFVLQTEQPSSHQSFEIADQNTIHEVSAGLVRIYRKIGSSYRLKQINDANGNMITIDFDDQENIVQISGTGGRAIKLEWSEGKKAHLLAVTDNAGRRVSLKIDGGLLRAVTDPAGARWTYAYQGLQLTQANDPLDRVLLRARYDRAGRAVEAGDAAGTNLYEYTGSDGISRRTVITDAVGSKTVFYHTERGTLAAVGDTEGQAVLRLEYDAANRPVNAANSSGADTALAYDSQNRLTRRSSSDGSYQAYLYDERGEVSSLTTRTGRTDYTRDERGNILAAKSASPAASYQVTRDSRGQPVTIKSDAGTEITSEYDASGNTSAYFIGGSGRFEIKRDAAGRIKSRRLPSGAIYNYEYDARGIVTKQSDGRGRSINFERDLSGAISGVLTANGYWVRAIRDSAGRIVSLKTSAGKSRSFAYEARGAITSYTDARGKRKQFGYDRRGLLRSVSDDGGNLFIIERDEKGRPQRISSVGYGRDKAFDRRSGRLHALKQGLSAMKFLPGGFSHGLPLISSLAQETDLSCFFGADEFTETDLTILLDFGFTCSDPFGGFGYIDPYAGGGYGYFDPFFGLEPSTGETCEQCKARQQQICEKEKSACSNNSVGGGARSVISCIPSLLGGGWIMLLCLGLVMGGVGAEGSACQKEYEACVLKIADKCQQCR